MALLTIAKLFQISLIFLWPIAQCLRILIYQDGLSPSQIAFSGALADVLVERGDIVDQIIMEFNPSVKSNGSSRIRNVYRIRMPAQQENAFIKLGHLLSPFHQRLFARRNVNFEATRRALCGALVDNGQLIAKLRESNYDVYLTSVYLGCTFGIFHLIGNIPTILGFTAIASTDGIFAFLGIPEPRSYVSSILRAYDYGDQLSFFARANNEWDKAIFGVDPVLDAEQPVFTAKDPTFPPLKQIATRLGFLFLNTNELLDLAKPISSKVKFIGGIAMQQGATELDEDFVGALSIANNASQQIILFSFGSLVKTWQIPARVEMEIVHALCHFPNYTIIWKYDGAGPGESETESEIRAEAVRKASKCTNLHKFNWIPQKALLKDPRAAMFITHMGLNSYLEAAKAGIPVVAIPFLGDQFYNAGCAVHKNRMGVLLEKGLLNAQTFANALWEVLHNPIYAANAQRLSAMLGQMPKTAKEIFVEHLEFAAAFPEIADNLQLAAVHLPLWKMHNMDVWAAALLVVLTACLIAILILNWLYKRSLAWLYQNVTRRKAKKRLIN